MHQPEHTPDPIRSVSFHPATHPANPFSDDDGLELKADEDPRFTILKAVAPPQSQMCAELLHTSLPQDANTLRNIIPQRNGFVHTAIEAYNKHRELIIRPDDVWLSILTQFSFYVNGNAEALRSVFVAHEGKKELVVRAVATRYSMDVAYMANEMTKLIEENVIDKSLRDWIMPDFTTSTHLDKSTSAIVMMGIMKNYFHYAFYLSCRIPRVTLEGEKRDWEEILNRLERLKKYGTKTLAWYHLLHPIISRFVSAYDNPNSPENLDFWNKIAHWQAFSGPPYLSGWITAFCTFKANGEWQGPGLDDERILETEKTQDLLQMSTSQFASLFVPPRPRRQLTLDGIPFATIQSPDIPCGYAYTDVTLYDNEEQFDTMLVAGSIGSQICSTEENKQDRKAVRSLPAWWYFIKKESSK